MNTVLAPILRKFVVVFIDDILIYSKTWAEHLHHIQKVFILLHKHQFKIKLSKCSFEKKLAYLGHVISAKGVAIDPTKVNIIKHWPTPVNVKEVRSFLGMTGYYRKFVQGFGTISKPLTTLLKKGSVFSGLRNNNSLFRLLKML